MFWKPPVEVVPPASRPYAVVDEIPVPPYGTPTTEPFHVPPVIVPPDTVRPFTAVADSAPPVMVAVLMVPVVVRLPAIAVLPVTATFPVALPMLTAPVPPVPMLVVAAPLVLMLVVPVTFSPPLAVSSWVTVSAPLL